LWQHYYHGADAVIFVLDSNDTERLEEASEFLQNLLSQDELRDAPVLVLANKQDLPRAEAIDRITSKLDMYRCKGRKWNVQACPATTGDGLFDGLNWLAKAVTRN